MNVSVYLLTLLLNPTQQTIAKKVKLNKPKNMKLSSTLFLLFLSTTFFAQEQFVLDNRTAYCSLFLKDGKLIGTCEKSFFTSFEINLTNQQLDSVSLFKQLPLSGIANVTYVPNSKENVDYKLKAEYDVTTRAGFPQILIKTSDGWFAMDNLKIFSDRITFEMDNDPDPPITTTDLMVINKTITLLQDEKHWNRNDDRRCKDDIENKIYSLFCALYSASVEVEGAYNHRSAIMQRIRKTIVDIYPNKELEHRLQSFNNLPETDHSVLMDLLTRVKNQVSEKLKD